MLEVIEILLLITRGAIPVIVGAVVGVIFFKECIK